MFGYVFDLRVVSIVSFLFSNYIICDTAVGCDSVFDSVVVFDFVSSSCSVSCFGIDLVVAFGFVVGFVFCFVLGSTASVFGFPVFAPLLDPALVPLMVPLSVPLLVPYRFPYRY